MIEKWYVVKVSEENKKKYHAPNNFTVFPCNYIFDQAIKRLGDTVVLITPSKDIAERTKKALNEQLREQGN
ncbi:hypothetical protein WRP3_054 [Lactococcus phage WRP3]|uniref:Uncharacterized protein n=2 Tax=Audreyjarvisvirus TaxID=2843351 RepID=A0A0D3MSS0_9CAUD|nr:hypothetical protein ACQ37_gp054 [Lactococcus phage WRP3]AIX12557.1 hypothetical protein WRP3_054 [Lactococcus phage WRP3]